MPEFDYTECVEAGAEAFWEEHGHVQFAGVDGEGGLALPWELVPGTIKAQIRIMIFEVVVAAVDRARYIIELENIFKGIEEGNSEN